MRGFKRLWVGIKRGLKRGLVNLIDPPEYPRNAGRFRKAWHAFRDSFVSQFMCHECFEPWSVPWNSKYDECRYCDAYYERFDPDYPRYGCDSSYQRRYNDYPDYF